MDGPQHFEQVSNWKTPEEQNKRDTYKIQCAINNNKHIIHINQEDVFYNKNNWENNVISCITDLMDCDIPTLKLIGIDRNWFRN